MSQATVLYDHPGPQAKRRNLALSVLFGVILLLALWWVLDTLAGKGELTGAKWRPFTTGDVWTNFLIPGLVGTIKAALISVALALPIGAVLAIGRLSDHAWIRWPSAIVVEFFRAIPVLLLMFFAREFYVSYTDVSSDSRPLFAVVTGQVLYNGSVLAEVFRSGVMALPRGQSEAAMAIGLRKSQIMRMILLPQAFTAMLPAIISQLVVVLKDTALGGQLVGYVDLMRQANTLTANFSNSVATYTAVGILYIALNFLLSRAAVSLERWMRRTRGTGAPSISATADPALNAGGGAPIAPGAAS